ncbi:MAG: DUF3795 domain-containing protein [Thermodesulfobacteriota bacterium]
MTAPTATLKPRKSLAGVCGLFCPACTLRLGTLEDPARLEASAARFNLPVEHLRCEGCRTEVRGFYCRECRMSNCAAEKGIDFCHECGEYPCLDLKQFQAARPHRLELWENLARIREAGFEAWFEEKLNHHACPECGTLNSAYDPACRRCGHEPGSEFVRRHKADIERYLKENR